MTDETAVTPEGLEALRREVEHLETVARREIAERIKIARDFGDLKENSEYHDAKNDQALLERRITILQDKLRNAVPVEADPNGQVVAFGSTVHVRDEDSGREIAYTIVGSTEADLSAGRLSVESPVAQALVGRSAGDTATITTPRGKRRLAVLRVGA